MHQTDVLTLIRLTIPLPVMMMWLLLLLSPIGAPYGGVSKHCQRHNGPRVLTL